MERFVYREEIYGSDLNEMDAGDVEDRIFLLRRLLFANNASLIELEDTNKRYFDWLCIDYDAHGRKMLKGLPEIEMTHETEALIRDYIEGIYYPVVFAIVEVLNEITKYISANSPIDLLGLFVANVSDIDLNGVKLDMNWSIKSFGRMRAPRLDIHLDDLIDIEIAISYSGAIGIRIKDKLGYFSLDGVESYEVLGQITRMREKVIVARSPIGGASVFDVVRNEDFVDLH